MQQQLEALASGGAEAHLPLRQDAYRADAGAASPDKRLCVDGHMPTLPGPSQAAAAGGDHASGVSMNTRAALGAPAGSHSCVGALAPKQRACGGCEVGGSAGAPKCEDGPGVGDGHHTQGEAVQLAHAEQQTQAQQERHGEGPPAALLQHVVHVRRADGGSGGKPGCTAAEREAAAADTSRLLAAARAAGAASTWARPALGGTWHGDCVIIKVACCAKE